jgi:hypothetical protein
MPEFFLPCLSLFQRGGEPEVADFFEVVVAGGGPAGVSAAIAAARAGAKTLLVERGEGLGGNVREAQVHSICGLYRINPGPEALPANRGFALEFARRLIAAGGASGPRRFGKLDVLLHEPDAFAALCETMVSETGGLEVARRTVLAEAKLVGRNLAEVKLRGRSGERVVRAGCFVEATGDGELAAMAGLGWEREEAAKLQRPAYIFGLSGVATSALEESNRMALAALLVSAVRSGRLGAEVLGAVIRPTGREGMVRVTLDLAAGAGNYDPTSAAQVEKLTVEARASAVLLAEFLRKEAAGFACAELASRPNRIGIRESRRVTGRSMVTANDVLAGETPRDTVCLSAWPMEMHESGSAMRLVYPRADAPCGVPLGALRSVDADNVFLAGRCVSATHEAQAALRVIGTSMATGQAAGLAAAMRAADREINEGTIRAIRAACLEGNE